MSATRVSRAAALFVLACACSMGPASNAPPFGAPLRLASFPDGTRVKDTRLAIEPLVPPGEDFALVDYTVDGVRVATRRASPWGWGEGGAGVRDVGELSFGAHAVRVVAHMKRGRTFSADLRVVYESPFAGVPSYASDIAPIFREHCASCHEHALAHDLASYERLRAMIPRVRASVREGRMPPDFALDAQSVALFTAWCDGYAPP